MNYKIIKTILIVTLFFISLPFLLSAQVNTTNQNSSNANSTNTGSLINIGVDQNQPQSDELDLLKQIQQNYETQNINQNNNQSSVVSLTQVLFRTIIIIIILFLIYIFIRFKLLSNKKTDENRLFKVLYSETIEKGIKLAILEFFGKYYIVSIGNNNISIVHELKTKDEIDYMKVLKSKYNIQPKTFLEFLSLSALKFGSTMKNNMFHSLKNRLTTLHSKEHKEKEDDTDE